MRMKDRSKRTLRIRRPRTIVVFASIMLALSLVITPISFWRKQAVIAASSTSIGTSMTFQRSDVQVTLRGLYTDTDDSVLIARLGVDPQSGAKLPSKGSDYRVFLSSDAYGKDVHEASILFGRLGTDGDMFLVLPKPTDKVYTVFIMNTMYLTTDANTGNDGSQSDPSDISGDDGEKSVTQALSDYSWDPNKKDGGEAQIKDDTSDMINFRMTLNPASNKAEYKPTIIDARLLDANGNFDFDAMFNKLFKEAAFNELSSRHDDLIAQEDRLKKSQQEYQNRLRINPDDTQAADALSQTNQSIQDVTNEKNKLAAQINAYENLKLTSDTFANLQTKAKVVHL